MNEHGINVTAGDGLCFSTTVLLTASVGRCCCQGESSQEMSTVRLLNSFIVEILKALLHFFCYNSQGILISLHVSFEIKARLHGMKQRIV